MLKKATYILAGLAMLAASTVLNAASWERVNVRTTRGDFSVAMSDSLRITFVGDTMHIAGDSLCWAIADVKGWQHIQCVEPEVFEAKASAIPTAHNELFRVQYHRGLLEVCGILHPTPITIHNTRGELVRRQMLNEGASTVELDGLAHGIYIVSIAEVTLKLCVN